MYARRGVSDDRPLIGLPWLGAVNINVSTLRILGSAIKLPSGLPIKCCYWVHSLEHWLIHMDSGMLAPTPRKMEQSLLKSRYMLRRQNGKRYSSIYDAFNGRSVDVGIGNRRSESETWWGFHYHRWWWIATTRILGMVDYQRRCTTHCCGVSQVHGRGIWDRQSVLWA